MRKRRITRELVENVFRDLIETKNSEKHVEEFIKKELRRATTARIKRKLKRTEN